MTTYTSGSAVVLHPQPRTLAGLASHSATEGQENEWMALSEKKEHFHSFTT
jgi:hypothetical protein